MARHEAMKLWLRLLKAVEGFDLTPTAAAAHTAALAQLTATRDDAKSGEASLPGWGAQVLQAAEDVLGTFVEQVKPAQHDRTTPQQRCNETLILQWPGCRSGCTSRLLTASAAKAWWQMLDASNCFGCDGLCPTAEVQAITQRTWILQLQHVQHELCMNSHFQCKRQSLRSRRFLCRLEKLFWRVVKSGALAIPALSQQ